MSQAQVVLLGGNGHVILTSSDLGQHLFSVTHVSRPDVDPLHMYTCASITILIVRQACKICASACVCLQQLFILILMSGHLQGSAHIMTWGQHWIASCLLSVNIHCMSLRLSTSLLSSTAREASLGYIALGWMLPCDIMTYWLLLCNLAREENVVTVGRLVGCSEPDLIISAVSPFTARSSRREILIVVCLYSRISPR